LQRQHGNVHPKWVDDLCGSRLLVWLLGADVVPLGLDSASYIIAVEKSRRGSGDSIIYHPVDCVNAGEHATTAPDSLLSIC
jgi:hypothetical protein